MLKFKGIKVEGQPDINEYDLKYNGKIMHLKKGAKIDVRDFDVANKDARNVELHLMRKNPGVLELSEDKFEDVSEETEKELKDLRAANEKLNADLANLKANYKELESKHGAAASEIEEMKKQVRDASKEVTKIKGEKKELEDEVDALRTQMASPKKDKK